MAHIVTLKSGGYETLLSLRDAYEIVEQHLGSDFREALEELTDDAYHLSDYTELEEAYEYERKHYREVMKKLWEQSEVIAELIRLDPIDRAGLSSAAGEIGVLTWKELL